MDEFETKVASNIARHDLLPDGKPVLVAVSGGADSVALLCSLHALGYECVVLHCNFHLRGEESNRDMRAVSALAAKLGVDLYVRDFDVEARRAATGESVEMACRELRYAWFADRLDRLRAQAIAVAHHREDNVETFFLNLMRGSGIAGLTGMRWRNGYVVRPLLDFTRAEIEQYLGEIGVDYVTDSTNAQSEYSRNRLRNDVLPVLAEHFPGAIDGILASMSHLAANRDLYDGAVAKLRESYEHGAEIDLQQLIAQEPWHRIALFEMLRPLGFNMTHVDNILASARKSGLRFTAGLTTLELDRGRLHISATADKQAAAATQVSLRRDILSPVHVLISEHPVTDFKPERDPMVAYFDVEVMEGDPVFAVRHWQSGDRIVPYGMDRSRLLSDLYSDAKYSAADKRGAYVLTRNGQVLWAIGLRQSGAYSIVPETRRYLRLQLRR